LLARWPGLVVGTHLAGAVDYRQVDYRSPILLVMGGEQAGLSPTLAAACETLVKIPMVGQADSLNLAVATGIMLFEIRRRDLRLDGCPAGYRPDAAAFAPRPCRDRCNHPCRSDHQDGFGARPAARTADRPSADPVPLSCAQSRHCLQHVQ